MTNRLLALITICFSLTAFASPCVTESCFIEHTSGDTLYLTNSEISPRDLPTLTNYLNQHSDITRIRLNYTTYCTGDPATCWKRIGDAGAIALAQTKYLTDIDLSFSNITNKGVMALSKNSRLRRLQLSLNDKLTGNDVAALAKLPALTELILDGTLIDDESIKALATSRTLKVLSVVGYHPAGNLNPASGEALAKNTSITHLNLSRQRLGKWGAIALASKLNLVSLDISDNSIGDQAASTFAKHPTLVNLNIGVNKLTAVSAVALAKNTLLKSLNIEVNDIGDEGAIALARHPTLESLNVNFNHISERGMIALAANPRLKYLSVGVNNLTEAGAIAIGNNTSLTALSLQSAGINDLLLSHIAKNSHLTSLDLSNNRIYDDGAVALAMSSSIEYLQLSSNYVADRGAIALAANDHLKTLDVRHNKIGEAGIQAFANSKIKQVYHWPQGL